jgi:hypothetical protein
VTVVTDSSEVNVTVLPPLKVDGLVTLRLDFSHQKATYQIEAALNQVQTAAVIKALISAGKAAGW